MENDKSNKTTVKMYIFHVLISSDSYFLSMKLNLSYNLLTSSCSALELRHERTSCQQPLDLVSKIKQKGSD